MIIEVYPNQTNQKYPYAYAKLLVADYHLEYPLRTDLKARVELVWHPFEVGEVIIALGGDEDQVNAVLEKTTAEMFGPLEEKYNGYYEHGMNLWLIQGSVNEIFEVYVNHAQACAMRPGGDDDTYDYWPNALEMLMVMAEDIVVLTSKQGYYFDKTVGALLMVVGAIDKQEGMDWDLFEAGRYRRELINLIYTWRKEDT